MRNIEGRLTKLENKEGVPLTVITIMVGETEEQARERHFAEYPEHRGARKEIIVRIRDFSRLHDGQEGGANENG